MSLVIEEVGDDMDWLLSLMMLIVTAVAVLSLLAVCSAFCWLAAGAIFVFPIVLFGGFMSFVFNAICGRKE